MKIGLIELYEYIHPDIIIIPQATNSFHFKYVAIWRATSHLPCTQHTHFQIVCSILCTALSRAGHSERDIKHAGLNKYLFRELCW